MSSHSALTPVSFAGLALAGVVAGAAATFVVTGATADAQTSHPAVKQTAGQSQSGQSSAGQGQTGGQSQQQTSPLPQGQLPQQQPQQGPGQSYQWGSGGGAPSTRSGGS